MSTALADRLESLRARGVSVVDPRQTYLDDILDLDRICAGAVLHPGARLVGPKTFVGPGAQVGSEGPAMLDNTVLGANSEVASGYLKDSVLLRDARVGANVHCRTGTLLEEEASVAHAVGLKHTILLSFVTMGSLINFCDALIAGGTSRRDHSEIGSGFIHFNFTPWGRSGDKATPSLIGDVPSGVFLRERRIFLGGMSGLVGPQKVGYGSMTVAGQVVRKEVAPSRLSGDVQRPVDKEFSFQELDRSERRRKLNLEYIGQLFALRAFYQEVRLRRIPEGQAFTHLRVVTEAAISLLSESIAERKKRLRDFAEERRMSLPSLSVEVPPCPLPLAATVPYVDHVAWVKNLPDPEVLCLSAWLKSIVQSPALAVPVP